MRAASWPRSSRPCPCLPRRWASTFAFRGQEAKDYYTGAIHRIFPLLVTLHKCKRLKKPEQQPLIDRFRKVNPTAVGDLLDTTAALAPAAAAATTIVSVAERVEARK